MNKTIGQSDATKTNARSQLGAERTGREGRTESAQDSKPKKMDKNSH